MERPEYLLCSRLRPRRPGPALVLRTAAPHAGSPPTPLIPSAGQRDPTPSMGLCRPGPPCGPKLQGPLPSALVLPLSSLQTWGPRLHHCAWVWGRLLTGAGRPRWTLVQSLAWPCPARPPRGPAQQPAGDFQVFDGADQHPELEIDRRENSPQLQPVTLPHPEPPAPRKQPENVGIVGVHRRDGR